MDTKLADKFVEKFASLYIKYQDKKSRLIKNLSDEDLEFLANHFDKQALGGDPQTCFGFRVELWDINADGLRAEINMRKMFRRAKESNLNCYCPTCDGICKGEEEHDRLVPALTADEMQVGEMSRDELAKEVLKWRGLNK